MTKNDQFVAGMILFVIALIVLAFVIAFNDESAKMARAAVRRDAECSTQLNRMRTYSDSVAFVQINKGCLQIAFPNRIR